MTDYVDLIFTRGPGPERPELIEVVDAQGNSVELGEWIERPDGTWALRIVKPDGP